jgi:hypothetical protein
MPLDLRTFVGGLVALTREPERAANLKEAQAKGTQDDKRVASDLYDLVRSHERAQ